jgi:hypothetical protein
VTRFLWRIPGVRWVLLELTCWRAGHRHGMAVKAGKVPQLLPFPGDLPPGSCVITLTDSTPRYRPPSSAEGTPNQ